MIECIINAATYVAGISYSAKAVSKGEALKVSTDRAVEVRHLQRGGMLA